MKSIIHQIRFSMEDMGPAEKRIASYILNHANEIVGISISELAQLCSCGDATIVRFARRLGLTGYQALKIVIAEEVASSSSIGSEIHKTDTCYEIYQKRISDIAVTLRNTASVLDPQQLEQAADAIMHANRILIFGLGNSSAVAQDAMHKFLRLGLNAQSCCDNHMQAIIASHAKPGTVVIGISHSGSSRDIVEALRISHSGGATTICITNFGNSPIIAESDICIFTKSEETKHSILAMSSRIAQLTIFDAIYTYIVVQATDQLQNAIYNTEIALQNKKY